MRALADAGWRDAFVAHGVPAPYSYAYRASSAGWTTLLSPASRNACAALRNGTPRRRTRVGRYRDNPRRTLAQLGPRSAAAGSRFARAETGAGRAGIIPVVSHARPTRMTTRSRPASPTMRPRRWCWPAPPARWSHRRGRRRRCRAGAGGAIVCHPAAHRRRHDAQQGGDDDRARTARVRRRHRALQLPRRGRFEGSFDNGDGEADDLRAVAAWVRDQRPDAQLWLAGFSFGAYVSLRLAAELEPGMLISIAPPAGRGWDFAALAAPQCPWLVIQGEADEIVDPPRVRLARRPQGPAQPTELVKMPDTSPSSTPPDGPARRDQARRARLPAGPDAGQPPGVRPCAESPFPARRRAARPRVTDGHRRDAHLRAGGLCRPRCRRQRRPGCACTLSRWRMPRRPR